TLEPKVISRADLRALFFLKAGEQPMPDLCGILCILFLVLGFLAVVALGIWLLVAHTWNTLFEQGQAGGEGRELEALPAQARTPWAIELRELDVTSRQLEKFLAD